MQIGIRAYDDNVEEASKLNSDYFEIAVRASYHKSGEVRHSYPKSEDMVKATNIRAFEKIRDKVIGIHGAIQEQGVNLMNRARNIINEKALGAVITANSKFDKCRYIVMHPGRVEKGYEEDCSFKYLYGLMKDYPYPKLCLEFVPVFSRASRDVFPMHSVDDFKRLKDKTGKEIVLDIGHAAITARAMRYDMVDYISKLIEELDIKILHIADNDDSGDGYNDSHLHIGKGDVPIEQIVREHKDKIEFAIIEVNGITPKDIGLVTSWLK